MNSINLNEIKFKESTPYNPIVQLLSVLPSSSSDLLPLQYRKLMTSTSNIGDYYPEIYEIDTYYKRYFWQCEPVLPLIDYTRIETQVKKIKMDHDLKKKLVGSLFVA